MLVVLNYILVGRPWVFREPRFCQNSRLLFILKYLLISTPGFDFKSPIHISSTLSATASLGPL